MRLESVARLVAGLALGLSPAGALAQGTFQRSPEGNPLALLELLLELETTLMMPVAFSALCGAGWRRRPGGR